ncbi:hypothetical protein BU25DRAFT_425444 [Macroventuria anomochaeta]|uniref:Uncharacterized protein n=1 Tax=Macroventuria anomochaeta TaxID=301207 RepID=A0ACB6RL44_9PLEO|nr:uncharacterized protein BU25DRAFT_425444 [Macroventuria anomochaeta]KAF2622731.1 hypothetical protein BU25DRAFT_425444 [Macroventuria anomochaeta]
MGAVCYLPLGLCTLMLVALTRSSFRQAHKVTSVGNGWVGVVVQDKSLSSIAIRPRKTDLGNSGALSTAAEPDFDNHDLVLISSPQPLLQRDHQLHHLQSSSSAHLVPWFGAHDELSMKSWFCSDCLLRAYS